MMAASIDINTIITYTKINLYQSHQGDLMDYRNIVIGAMVLIISLMVGFNVALYLGAQDQNVTQLDWSDNATTDMSFANEFPGTGQHRQTQKPPPRR
ncbi:unknown [Methanothermobacter thermautotrophicus str. Delta H]|uniref:Uncharacterized protein n=2 Tax=Methanothermobacter thermautotrophicus TaxID=145262 RepID=O27519_METTH|nr:unknown [Methanothermobacter thermautotrophicus str. Delta H]